MPGVVSSNKTTNKILNSPAYTTILSQAFSPDGEYLAIGNDRGRVAIFHVSDLASAGRDEESSIEKLTCLFYFDATNEKTAAGFESINTLSSSKNFLIAALSSGSTEVRIVGWAWNDILKQAMGVRGSKREVKISWTIEEGAGILPSDVNAIVVDEKCDAVPGGRLFVAGGTYGSNMKNDHAIRIVDLETRSETSPPLQGHSGYIHDVSYCNETQTLASASEDGTVRVWDLRATKKSALVLTPSKHGNLARPGVGGWMGAVSLSGELICCGGGPRAALYHLRTLTPVCADGLQIPEMPDCSGSVHAIEMMPLQNRIVVGGEMHGKMFHTNLSGDLIAEIETSFSCLYSVVHVTKDSFKVLSCAGSSSKVDVCVANFSYRDRVLNFPL